MKRGLVLLLLAWGAFVASAGGLAWGALAPMRFPGAEWEVVAPAEEGIDAEKLQAAVEYLKAHSGGDGVRELVIVRRGRIVWQGDNIDHVHGVWSCTKSFTSTVLGLLIDDGKCTLETPCALVYPALQEKYPGVTLRHFTTMTSGYRAKGDAEATRGYRHGPSATPFVPAEPLFAPGAKYAYWDSAMNVLGLVLTRIADEPMEGVLKRRVMDPIGVPPDQWRWGERKGMPGPKVNGGSGNRNGHIQISARGLARFGHLFLNRGKWKDQQIISERWVDQATAVQVPADVVEGFPPSNFRGSGRHGFNWWVNGVDADGKRKWPSVPATTFAALGHNNNKLWILPEWRMVIVRLGLDQRDREIDDAVTDEFLKRVGVSLLDKTANGS